MMCPSNDDDDDVDAGACFENLASINDPTSSNTHESAETAVLLNHV